MLACRAFSASARPPAKLGVLAREPPSGVPLPLLLPLTLRPLIAESRWAGTDGFAPARAGRLAGGAGGMGLALALAAAAVEPVPFAPGGGGGGGGGGARVVAGGGA
jgi:hypothetical protein